MTEESTLPDHPQTKPRTAFETALNAARVALATAGIAGGIAITAPAAIRAHAAIEETVKSNDLQNLPKKKDAIQILMGVNLATAGGALALARRRKPASSSQQAGDENTPDTGGISR